MTEQGCEVGLDRSTEPAFVRDVRWQCLLAPDDGVMHPLHADVENLFENLFLRSKVIIEASSLHRGGNGDLIERRCRIPFLAKYPCGCVQDAQPA